MEPAPKRRIPRIATVMVPVLAVALAAFLVSVAWRSDRTARTQPPDEPVVPLDTSSDVFLGCSDCHGDLDKVFKDGEITNLLYTHEKHFPTGVSDCSVCHPADTHVQDRINKPTMSRCFMCHGKDPDAIAPGTCDTCHPEDMPAIPDSHLTGQWFPTQHAKAARIDQFECLTCHEQRSCDSCHGLKMPHPQEWQQLRHAYAYFDDPATCQQCHPRAPDVRDFCDTCHHPRGPDDVAWRDFHPNVVTKDGAFTCFQCHNPATCASCHVDGTESYEADEQQLRTTPQPTPSTG